MLSSGGIRFNFQKTDIVQIIKTSINSLLNRIKEKSLNISYTFEKEPFYIDCDSERFTEVIDNILGNAIKFSGENSRVKVLLRKKDRNNAEIIIEDTGIGISDKDLKNIFDRFYTHFDGFSKEYQGLGLGLSIVKEIIDRHNGTITISSKKGEGTKVFINLPIKHCTDEKGRVKRLSQ